MRCGGGAFVVGEMDVAADVPGGNAHRARHCNEEVREVLAHAGAQLEHLVHRAVHVGDRAVVLEVAADRQG